MKYLFLFINFLNIFLDFKPEAKARWSFEIIDAKKFSIGKKFYYFETKNYIIKNSYIYIISDNKKYMEIVEIPSYEYDDINFQINKNKKLKNLSNTGIEISYKMKIILDENTYKFNIYGDVTYIYIVDIEGIKRYNKEALEYIINKNIEIKEFIEIMASEKKYFPINFIYLFSDEQLIKDLGLIKNKYKIKEKYFPCTEIEEILGYDCNKYKQISKK